MDRVGSGGVSIHDFYTQVGYLVNDHRVDVAGEGLLAQHVDGGGDHGKLLLVGGGGGICEGELVLEL